MRYHFDDGRGGRAVAEGEFSAWTTRPDLADFPDARDPRPPYVFDLFWDAKHRSQLNDLLMRAPDGQAREIRAAMAEHGIVLDDPETSDIESATPAPGP